MISLPEIQIQAPTLLTAFFAGMLTFLSPCIFPLLPGYMSFMSGESLENLRNHTGEGNISPRMKAFLGALCFGLGFTLIFVILGATATTIGKSLVQYKAVLAKVSGIIIIIFGLHMIGIFKIKTLLKQSKFNYKKHSFPFYIEAFLLGIALVLGWTPCIGPILTSILFVAAQESSVNQGIILLLVYSLGLWIPFLVSALAINEVMKAVRKTGKYLIWVERTAGALLVLMGILLLTDQMTKLSIFFSELFDFIPLLG